MTTGIVIFARHDSRRLPGKALVEIAGSPMLGHVVRRARRVARADMIALATSDRPTDDALAAFAAGEGIAVFRGALDDVAGRGLACARRFGLRRFARLCGDRPFFDPALMDMLIDVHDRDGADLATTQSDRPYPPGLTTEIVATEALARAHPRMDAEDREHVTRFFYRNDGFAVVRVPAPPDADFAGVRLVVDDAADLERARFIAGRLGGRVADASRDEIVALARAWQPAPDRAAATR